MTSIDPTNPLAAPPNAIAALRRFARPRQTAEERCELCAAALAPDHQHLLDPPARQVLCTCDACAILFSGTGATKYRRISRRIEAWPDLRLTDAQWDALGVPIGLAFFYHSTPAGHMVSAYPSPAGATEAALAAEPWQMLADDNPVLATLAPDVEALLVNRVAAARDYYRVPIDECFKLVGLIRTHWRGMSGGATVWQRITEFFAGLAARSKGAGSHA
jgi:hypothetical protein